MIHFPAEEMDGFKQDLHVTTDTDDSSTLFDALQPNDTMKWQSSPDMEAPLPKQSAGTFLSTRRLRSMRRTRLLKSHQRTIHSPKNPVSTQTSSSNGSSLFSRKSRSSRKKHVEVTLPDDELSLQIEDSPKDPVSTQTSSSNRISLFSRKSRSSRKKHVEGSFPDDELSLQTEDMQVVETTSCPDDEQSYEVLPKTSRFKKPMNRRRATDVDDESKFSLYSLEYRESFYQQVESALFDISCNIMENFVDLCCRNSNQKKMEIVDPTELAEEEGGDSRTEQAGNVNMVETNASSDNALQKRAREIVARNQARNLSHEEIRPILKESSS
jgi:hypothetical protein